MRTHHYPPTGSQIAERLTTFRQQMADFARGEQFRALRQSRHLSQEDAAHEIGVSTKALREWEKGGKIKWENAKAAAKFFDVDPEMLVSRDATDDLPVLANQAQLDRIEETQDRILRELAAIRLALAGPSRRQSPPQSRGQKRATGS